MIGRRGRPPPCHNGTAEPSRHLPAEQRSPFLQPSRPGQPHPAASEGHWRSTGSANLHDWPQGQATAVPQRHHGTFPAPACRQRSPFPQPSRPGQPHAAASEGHWRSTGSANLHDWPQGQATAVSQRHRGTFPAPACRQRSPFLQPSRPGQPHPTASEGHWRSTGSANLHDWPQGQATTVPQRHRGTFPAPACRTKFALPPACPPRSASPHCQ